MISEMPRRGRADSRPTAEAVSCRAMASSRDMIPSPSGVDGGLRRRRRDGRADALVGLVADAARAGRGLAPEPQDLRQHLPRLPLPDPGLVGAAARQALQRRLRLDPRRQAPPRDGRPGPARSGRRSGTSSGRCSTASWSAARRPGPTIRCSRSAARATPRSATSPSPTARSATRAAASAASSPPSPRRPSASWASAAWRRCASWRRRPARRGRPKRPVPSRRTSWPQNAADLPFALIYLLDGEGRPASLAGAAGLAPGGPSSPAVVGLAADAGPPGRWPAPSTRGHWCCDDLGARLGDLPGGPWSEPAHTAVVLPIAQAGQERPAGVLVAGVSPRRELDDAYRGFLDLVAGQLASGIVDARAYEAERTRAEALAELDQAKTAFFSNVSHEFRTPLTLMLGPLEDVLAQPDDLSSADRERLTVAHRNALRLLRLVNTLLDFSRIEAGRVQASYEPTDLPRYTADLASTFRSALERAGLRPDRGLPAAAARPGGVRRPRDVGEDRPQPALQRLQVHLRRARSRWRCGRQVTPSSSSCATPASASRPTSCRVSSSGSTASRDPRPDAGGHRHRAGARPGAGQAPRRRGSRSRARSGAARRSP